MAMTGTLETERWRWPGPLALTEGERGVWFPPPRPDICDWVEDSYRLPPEVSDEPGPWNLEYVPFMIEPLQKAAAPPVKIGIEGCTQFGKTHYLGAVFGYIVDVDPGPTLLLMPTQKDVERRVQTRWIPTFRDSPRLLRHVFKRDLRNINVGKQTIFDRMIAYLAWSRSPASMSDNSICNVLIDEPGKFDLVSATGEDPFDLAEKRIRGYELRSRVIYATSPQDRDDLPDQQFRAGSDARFWVPCHACGKWHPIGAERETLYIEKDKEGNFYDPEMYKLGDAKAWYRCPRCGEKWTEMRRARAIAAGRWVHKTQRMLPDGRIEGAMPRTRHWTYRINSMMIHFRFWTAEKEACEFVKAQYDLRRGDIKRLKDYTRNQRAEPWEERARTVDDDALARRVLTDLHRRQVPPGALMLVAGADYHEDEEQNVRIDYEVRAFGMDLQNWVIAAGSAVSWEDFENELFLPFPWQDPNCSDEELNVSVVFVDSGFKADEVYLWCAKFPGWAWPIKGVEKQRTPLVISDLGRIHEERRRRGKRRMKAASAGAQQLVLIDQAFFSEMITTWAEPAENTTGQMWFYAEISQDTRGAYFKEFAGFVKVKQQIGRQTLFLWKPRTHTTPVHFHDTNRIAAAAGWFNKAHLQRSAFLSGRLPPAMAERLKSRAPRTGRRYTSQGRRRFGRGE